MAEAISNTSPLLYLYRVEALHLLPALFGEVWTPQAVLRELGTGRERGYDVPDLSVDRLERAGMRISTSIRQRVMALAEGSDQAR